MVSETVCDTSPLQYLHQLRLLDLLRVLFDRLVVPPAVAGEISTGLRRGFDLPRIADFDWIAIRPPIRVLDLAPGLGPGEREVLALAFESADCTALLDDGLARAQAKLLRIRTMGTLGVLLKAKQKQLIPQVGPLLEELNRLQFRLDPATRDMVLKLASE